MNEVLAELFRYNAWANERLLTACSSLSDEHLDSQVAGTFGSIRQTIVHLTGAQDGFSTGYPARTPNAWPPTSAGGRLSRESGPDSPSSRRRQTTPTPRLRIAEAAAATEDSMVELPPFQGRSSTAKKSFLLLHAFEHGVEHRTQITTTLAQFGIEAPNLDGWAYAEETPGLLVMDE